MQNIKFETWQVLPNDIRSQMDGFLQCIQTAMISLQEYETAVKMESASLDKYKRKLYDDLTAIEDFFDPQFFQ